MTPIRWRFLVPAIVILALSACSDGPAAPSDAAALDLVSGDDQPGTTSAPLEEPLVIKVVSSTGTPVQGATVTWAVVTGGGTVTPQQSVSDDNGLAQTTWTLGAGAGEQQATATLPGVTPVTFSASASDPAPTCNAAEPLDLEVGGSILLVGPQAAELCVAGGTGRDYVAVAYNTSRTTFSSISLSVTATGVAPIIGPPSPDVTGELAAMLLGYTLPDADFHQRLREKERDDLGPLVGTGGGRLSRVRDQLSPALSLANPTVGETFTINANANSSCTTPLNKTARVVAISQHAIIMEDQSNPTGGFTTSEYQAIGATFDALVHPVDVEHFGEPDDIDNNGKIVIFYTREVNSLTPSGSPNGYVAGFFFARDLFPRQANARLQACNTSNESELVYLMVPDPLGTINGNVRDKNFVRNRTISTLAHEFEHLINSSRRMYINTTARFPEKGWMEEGLAHSAEELVFLEASGLSPLQNFNGTTISSTSQRLEAFNDFQIENILRVLEYMKATRTSAAFDSDLDLGTRGASYWFLRYLVDRKGGTQLNTWRALVNGPDTGFRNLESVIQADPTHWMRDWAASHYLDDISGTVPAKYRMLSWNLRSVVNGLEPSTLYPIRPPAQANGIARTAALIGGGAEYFRFGAQPGGEARIVFATTGGNALPATLSVIVARTR